VSRQASQPSFIVRPWLRAFFLARIVLFVAMTLVGLWAVFFRLDSTGERALGVALTGYLAWNVYRAYRLYRGTSGHR
jgi:hypothetical protein